MVAQNLIFVRESLIFIPSASEQERKITNNEKKNWKLTCLHQQKLKVLKTLLL